MEFKKALHSWNISNRSFIAFEFSKKSNKKLRELLFKSATVSILFSNKIDLAELQEDSFLSMKKRTEFIN